MMNIILQHLKKHGESLDVELAEAAGMSLDMTRTCLANLSATGEIMTYHSTRFQNGEKIEGVRCRLAGYIPPPAPGRRAK
jgi:DNA-binding IclR family transcriptional regulator